MYKKCIFLVPFLDMECNILSALSIKIIVEIVKPDRMFAQTTKNTYKTRVDK